MGEAELFGPPAACFTSSEWYDRDLQVMFRPRWQLAAHSSELREPGTLMRFTSGPDEAVVVRARDGRLRGYRNFCRHRGHRLCPADSAQVRQHLVCSYHGWSYSVEDGSLQTAPRMHEGFDHEPWALREVWVEEHRDLVFVAFGPERPPAVADLLATSEPDDDPSFDALGGYDFGRMKVAGRSSWEVEANWKLAVENNLECYHCRLNHPELCRVIDPWALPTRYGSDDSAPTIAEIRALAAKEVRRSREFDARFSFDGARACARPLPRIDDRPGPTLFMHIAPYNVIAPTADYVWTWAVDPLAADRSRVRHMFLVHEDAEDGVDYDTETLVGFWNTVMAQDEPLCSEMQCGIAQPTYTPGPLNKVHQMFPAGFYLWYQDTMHDHGYDATYAERVPEVA